MKTARLDSIRYEDVGDNSDGEQDKDNDCAIARTWLFGYLSHCK
jgi:hypothetical protein